MSNLVEQVKQAGIIGAGGAGFPTHVKIDATADTVIANGAECEPLLRVDQQLMREYSDRIVQGLGLVMRQTGAARGYIAIKKKHKEAVEKLKAAVRTHGGVGIEVFEMDNYYPAGDEQILVYDITGRVIPEGGIPLQVGAVVSNVHSLYHIYEASQGIPVTWRYVTVTGCVKKPGTFRVPIGTGFQDLVKRAGGAATPDPAYLVGGPMMGRVGSGDEAVTKTTSGVIVLPADHYVVTSKSADLSRSLTLARAACCQCTYCTMACPRNLLGHSIEPHKVMRAVAFGIADYAFVENALYCVGCGVCTYYACPMGIDPFRMCTQMKNELIKQGIKPQAKKETYHAREFYEARKVPVPLLISRLNLNQYDVDAPLDSELFNARQVRIGLKQHIGAPAKPVVAAGSTVTAGDLVAEPEGKLSAAVHASITGTVTAVTDTAVEITA